MRAAPYRSLLLLVFLTSISSSGALTVVALFGRDLGASPVQITVYFVVVALVGMLAVLVTGGLSDRGRARRILIPGSFAWLAIGYALLAGVDSIAGMFLIGAMFVSAINVAHAQLLAHARDIMIDCSDPDRSITTVSLIRVVFSAGSMLGFGLGGVGMVSVGARGIFGLAAVAYVLCLALSLVSVRSGAWAGPPGTVSRRDEPGAGEPLFRLVAYFSGIMALFISGRVMQISQLPIVVHESLGAGAEWVGLLLAVPPLAELVLMPVMAWAAQRWGRGNVFLLGALASVVYYAGVTVAQSPWQMLVLQGCYAVFGAAAIMVGIDIAQRLMSSRPGLATSAYLSHENLAVVTGSIVATASVAALGSRLAFLVPAALCLTSSAMTVMLFARHRTRFDLRHLGKPQRRGHAR